MFDVGRHIVGEHVSLEDDVALVAREGAGEHGLFDELVAGLGDGWRERGTRGWGGCGVQKGEKVSAGEFTGRASTRSSF